MPDPYEALLDHAYENITETSGDEGRFTVPPAKVFIEGGKTTVLDNFAEIASVLRREPDHLMKFLLGELGTSGKIDGNRAVFNGKFEFDLIKSLVKKYTEDYVICSECGKPDTRLVKDGRITLLRCDACGSHRPVRKRRARPESVANQLEEGKEMTVEIQSISKRGDGVVRIGKYTMYVSGGKPGQKIQIRITRVAGSIVFTERM
ncbi:translation initiation factor IF-2 subunit beta [Methanogenium cariaci]|uniref:translation initiation factor IF-2 subunit beta n=1 Tax=Methanogenium cariaci TaxID=2197 RepID=UPI00078356EE|nr:translation initiation factor IF-2 subunit beta [Methanogenium cariaci]